MGIDRCMFLITFFTALQLTCTFSEGTRIQGLQYILKTIEVDGEGTVDCINIYKQPAFDHPLLVNHTIQIRPSLKKSRLSSKKGMPWFNQFWQKYEPCPKGSIPIIRRQQNSSHHFRRRHVAQPSETYNQGHQYAVIQTRRSPGTIHGVHAKLNVWNPKVNPNTFSLSQVWLLAGSSSKLNTMEAGWHVFPGFNKDTKTRFFIYWTSDGYESTGCYDLACPGFLQTNSRFILGSPLDFSTYDGHQVELDVSIEKDRKSGNWWVYVEGKAIGYWPPALFTSIAEAADAVEYGGETYDPNEEAKNGDENSTPIQMGSGHFPSEGYQRSSYIREFTYIDTSGSQIHPKSDDLIPITTSPSCYKLQLDNRCHSFLYFGGPGCH